MEATRRPHNIQAGCSKLHAVVRVLPTVQAWFKRVCIHRGSERKYRTPFHPFYTTVPTEIRLVVSLTGKVKRSPVHLGTREECTNGGTRCVSAEENITKRDHRRQGDTRLSRYHGDAQACYRWQVGYAVGTPSLRIQLLLSRSDSAGILHVVLCSCAQRKSSDAPHI